MSGTLAYPPQGLPATGPTVALGRVTPQLAFLTFLLTNATVFLRPGEMVPALLGLPIYEALILSSLALSLNAVRDRVIPGGLARQPINLCVLGLFVAIVLSHAQYAYLSGVVESADLFVKVALYYLLFVSLVDTPRRFEIMLISTALCATVMISLCVIDYWGWVDFTFIEHVVDRDGETITGDENLIIRMRGTGIFEDPNDIGLLIVCTGVLSTFFLTERRYGNARFFWIVPILIMGAALYCTRSRGALLSTGAAGLAFMLYRYGKGYSLAAGLCGALLLPLVAGRQANIDLEDGTGQERIQMWAEGLAELKSPAILFGVGQGMYADIAGLVAHNSYVHAYVELGFFGGTFFFGAFYFIALGLYRLMQARFRTHRDGLLRFAPFLAALVGGYGMGIFSLSRCYVAPTYMVLGIATSYLSLVSPLLDPPRYPAFLNWTEARKMVLASAGMLAFLYLLVKVLVRFS